MTSLDIRRLAGAGVALAALAGWGCDLSTVGQTVPIGPAVSIGTTHTCALWASGDVYCWGSNRYGELGIGTSDTLAHSTPVRATGLPRIAALSAGEHYTCGLTTTGAAWCWGYGGDGALGNGDTLTRVLPTLVSGNLAFTTITTGRGGIGLSSHTCAVTLGGVAYCWGLGAYGQLGNGGNASKLVPTLVTGGLRFRSISAGETHTCGTTLSATYCWGANAHGALGSGTPFSNVLVPTAVSGTTSFAVVQAGFRYSCAVTFAVGPAWCWGLNRYGTLGATTPNSCLGFSDDFFPCSTVAIAVQGAPDLLTVATGLYHSCGLTPDGEAYCWGSNTRGQLGAGTPGAQNQPPAPVNPIIAFVQLGVGGTHTCGLTGSPSIYCWGSNSVGELGDGTTTDRTSPVRVLLP